MVDQHLGSDPNIAVPEFWTVAKDHISQLELGELLSNVLRSTGNKVGTYQLYIIKEGNSLSNRHSIPCIRLCMPLSQFSCAFISGTPRHISTSFGIPQLGKSSTLQPGGSPATTTLPSATRKNTCQPLPNHPTDSASHQIHQSLGIHPGSYLLCYMAF